MAALSTMHLHLVAVSLYGATPATHDAITGVPGSFERALTSLKRLRAAGIACRISNVLMRDNFAEFEAVMLLADDLGCKYLAEPMIRPTTAGDRGLSDDQRLREAELREFYAHPAIIAASAEGKVLTAEAPKSRTMGNCSAGFASATIDARGDVLPCVGLAGSWGNIRDMSLVEAWRGLAAERFRAEMSAPLRECADCDLIPFCTGRCPWMALLEDGDACGRSANACERARLIRDMWTERH